MTENNILGKDQRNSYHCICCLNVSKTHQRETELFEFSRKTNREELKLGKNDVTSQWLCCNDVTLQWICCNDVSLQWLCYNGFCLSSSLMFTNKATHFLDDGLYRKILACCQRQKCNIKCSNYFTMTIGQEFNGHSFCFILLTVL